MLLLSKRKHKFNFFLKKKICFFLLSKEFIQLLNEPVSAEAQAAVEQQLAAGGFGKRTKKKKQFFFRFNLIANIHMLFIIVFKNISRWCRWCCARWCWRRATRRDSSDCRREGDHRATGRHGLPARSRCRSVSRM